ncbi:MAG: response regulator [Planctomycetes bacterium]|nr:response regulator [Planctomycetota bacterium]
MSRSITRRKLQRYPRVSGTSRVLALVGFTFGIAVICGWLFGIEKLHTPIRNTVSVKFNAALGFVVLGVALWSMPWKVRRARIGYVIVFGWGMLHLLQDAFAWRLGLDELFVKDDPQTRYEASPGRMALTTSVAFCLVGFGGFLTARGWSRLVYWGQAALFITVVLAVMGVVGYAYGASDFYWFEGHTAMALPTAAILFLVAVGVVLSRRDFGIGRIMGLHSPAGVVFRSALPAAIAVPVLIGWLAILGARERWWAMEFALSMTTVASASVLVLVLYNAAARASETEAALTLRDRALESTEVAIVIADATREDRPIVEVNAAFERMTGYRASEILGKNCRFLNERARDQDALDVLREAIDKGISSDVVLLNHRKDGVPFWNRLVLSPVRSAFGELTHFVSVSRDVTGDIARQNEREELLRSSKAAHEAAQKALEARDVFLGVVSHELRSPLHSARLWASILLEAGADVEPSQVATHLIRSIDAQARLVSDLLDVSRFTTADGIDLDRSSQDLRPLVEQTALDLTPTASEAGLDLSIDLPSNSIASVVDADRMSQVIRNLIENAIKFTSRGGSIEVRLRRDGAHAVIDVLDSGVGISQEDRGSVFQRFWRAAETSKSVRGLGLGLAIVKHVVEKHGGTVGVWSEGRGFGSTFSVRLPTSDSVATPEVVPQRRHEPIRSRSALVVDDESSARFAMLRILEAHGFQVVAAASAEEALEKIREAPVSLLVSDIMLPGMSGHDLIRSLRDAEHFGDEPVAIAVSGRGAPRDRRRALDAGFDAFLAKPVVPSTLLELIDALVAGPESDDDEVPDSTNDSQPA